MDCGSGQIEFAARPSACTQDFDRGVGMKFARGGLANMGAEVTKKNARQAYSQGNQLQTDPRLFFVFIFVTSRVESRHRLVQVDGHRLLKSKRLDSTPSTTLAVYDQLGFVPCDPTGPINNVQLGDVLLWDSSNCRGATTSMQVPLPSLTLVTSPLCGLSFSSLLVSLLLSCSLSSSLPSLLLSPTRRVERPAAMSGKMRIRTDPKAPASDRQAMAIDSTPSASSNDALSVASSPPSASTPSVPSASPPTAGTSSPQVVPPRSKRPRPHQSDEVIDVDNDEKAGPSSSPSSVASSSLPPSGGSALGGQSSLPSVAQTASNAAGPQDSSSSGTLPPVNAGSTMSFVPSFVRRDTLLQQAGIDSRSDDTLVVDVQVLAAHHAGTPVISSLQYRSNEEARRDCAVSFIKKDTGLAMVCPVVPQYLTLRGGDFDAAIAKLSPEQRVWHDQLVEQARLSFDTVRDNSCSDGDKLDACEWVWQHLGRATGVGPPSDVAAPLWASPSSHVATWGLLLKYLGTSIMTDKCPAAGSTSSVHSYTLRVQGANRLLTHVLACQFSSYALLRSEAPEITKEWQALLLPRKGDCLVIYFGYGLIGQLVRR